MAEYQLTRPKLMCVCFYFLCFFFIWCRILLSVWSLILLPFGMQDSKQLKVSNIKSMKMDEDVLAVVISPDSKFIAIALLNNVVKVWLTFHCVYIFFTHKSLWSTLLCKDKFDQIHDTVFSFSYYLCYYGLLLHLTLCLLFRYTIWIHSNGSLTFLVISCLYYAWISLRIQISS